MKPLRLILLIGAGAAIAPAEPLLTGCDSAGPEIAQVRAADNLRIVSAIAGEGETCYEAVLKRDGNDTTGYLLGENSPAVQAFVRQREKAAVDSFQAQDEWAHLMAKQAKTPAPAVSGPKPGEVFEDFSARDLTGKSISLSGLGGRVTLVTFWSPRSPGSVNQLASLLPLFNQYRRSGLRAVGISADPNASHSWETLDDVTLGWPQIPDHAGLAAKYGADPKKGTTLVLDSSHHIVAAGLSGSDLEQKVRQLLAQP